MKKLFYLIFLIPVTAFLQWTHESSGTTYPLSSVYFNNPDTGYAVGGYYGAYGAILKTIETSPLHAKSQLSIMNLNGEEVLTRSLIKPKTQLDIGNLPGGIYFVRLTNESTVFVEKFVKQ